MNAKLNTSVSNCCLSRFRGVSLVEILVTIMVVGVLAGIIYSLASAGITASKQVVNASNLRSIGAGILNYAADHNGDTPPHVQFDSAQQKNATWAAFGNYNRSSWATPKHLVKGGYAAIDHFFSPFAEIHANRKQGFWPSPNNIGYFFLIRPRDPTASVTYPTWPEEYYNCSIQESPRAIMYFNPAHPAHINTLQYTSNRFSVVHLDGTVRTHRLEDIRAHEQEGGDFITYYIQNK